ncbi:hypothetical protein [Micromonospora sp. I033]
MTTVSGEPLHGIHRLAGPAQGVATSVIGESDLVHRDEMWFLYASIEVAEATPYEPDGFFRVDMGIANIAYNSDGTRYAGTRLNGYRRRQMRLRARLQQKGTTSAKRLLARRNKKEARHAAPASCYVGPEAAWPTGCPSVAAEPAAASGGGGHP